MKAARMILLRRERALMLVIKESTRGNLATRARPLAAMDVRVERLAFSDSIDSSACSMTVSAFFSAECRAPRSRRIPSERGLLPVVTGHDAVMLKGKHDELRRRTCHAAAAAGASCPRHACLVRPDITPDAAAHVS